MSIIRKSLDQKRLVSIITILTKREEWSKIKLSKSKIIAITINQMEREVQQKIFKNKSVQNTIISIPKVKLAFIKVL